MFIPFFDYRLDKRGSLFEDGVNMSEVTNQKKYRTSDLYFAAYLKTAKIKLVGQDREGRRIFFIFDHDEIIPELQTEYFNRTGKVAALSYADEIKAMKALTHMSK